MVLFLTLAWFTSSEEKCTILYTVTKFNSVYVDQQLESGESVCIKFKNYKGYMVLNDFNQVKTKIYSLDSSIQEPDDVTPNIYGKGQVPVYTTFDDKYGYIRFETDLSTRLAGHFFVFERKCDILSVYNNARYYSDLSTSYGHKKINTICFFHMPHGEKTYDFVYDFSDSWYTEQEFYRHKDGTNTRMPEKCKLTYTNCEVTDTKPIVFYITGTTDDGSESFAMQTTTNDTRTPTLIYENFFDYVEDPSNTPYTMIITLVTVIVGIIIIIVIVICCCFWGICCNALKNNAKRNVSSSSSEPAPNQNYQYAPPVVENQYTPTYVQSNANYQTPPSNNPNIPPVYNPQYQTPYDPNYAQNTNPYQPQEYSITENPDDFKSVMPQVKK